MDEYNPQATPSTDPLAPPPKKNSNIWTILSIAFVVISVGFSAYPDIKEKIAQWKSSTSVAAYRDEVDDCVKEQQAKLGDTKVIGLDYSCAIEIAATIYTTNPETALALCLKYNPFGMTENANDDYFAQSQLNTAKASCTSSIEKRLNASPENTNKAPEPSRGAPATPSPTDPLPQSTTLPTTAPVAEPTLPPASSPKNQKTTPIEDPFESTGKTTYTNTTYGYTINLETTDRVGGNEYATVVVEAFNVTIQDKNRQFLATIEVIDPALYSDKTEAAYRLPLKDYVAKIAEMNGENVSVQPLPTTSIDGVPGYTMSIDRQYTSMSGGYLFMDTFPTHTFIFVEHNGLKYSIEVPESMGHRGLLIARSLKFQ